ncbi:MAG: hypothetical protein ACTSRT_20475 [Promethearchaeota archaeon]
MYAYINEKTGFADGEQFQSRKEVKGYFTVKNMNYLYGAGHELTQEHLDEMAELVIQKKWHVKITTTRVFSIRLNRSDSREETDRKLSELKLKIEK